MPRKYTRRQPVKSASAIASAVQKTLVDAPWNSPKVLLIEAAEHIRQLKRANDILNAKVSTMDLFDRVVRTLNPSRDQCMTAGIEPIEHRLTRAADNL